MGMRFLLLLAGLVWVAVGCTSQSTLVAYEPYGAYASDRAGNRPYTELGPVSATRRAQLWLSCRALATRVMERLDHQRSHLGGDAIVQVRWRDHRTDQPANVPHCTREWGWTGLFVVGALGPWTQVAHAEALVIRFEEP